MEDIIIFIVAIIACMLIIAFKGVFVGWSKKKIMIISLLVIIISITVIFIESLLVDNKFM